MRGVRDDDGYVVSINPAYQAVLGWSIEELSAAPHGEFVHPDDQDWVNRCQRMLLTRAEALFGLDIRMLRRDGTYQWTQWSARSAPRQQVCFEGVTINGHDPCPADAPVLVGSWTWHLRTDAVTWSAEMFQIYGLPAQVPVSREAAMARVHPADRLRVQAAIQASITTGEPYRCDHRIQHLRGGCRVLHSVGRVTSDADGEPELIRGITMDRTHDALRP